MYPLCPPKNLRLWLERRPTGQ
uniref:Uncharacterized protein n=1 Tax=Anguilla anguilla TaxID=7936 RepID=A0A0E9TRH2_ANGAN